ncbi:MAG: hypothetical protein K8U03_04365 [Planctomycetia bacterium]|nr:hypothetical protein [Planctomycetia bacterium]
MISHNNDEDSTWQNWIVERRPQDGAILVRVPSTRRDSSGDTLPDAVFSFRDGDPQYRLWSERLENRSPAKAS